MILEKYWEYNKNLYQIYIDYRQAYDSIHRTSMWQILKEYGIPQKLITMIKACYNNSKCCIKLGKKTSAPFTVESGLRQGCMLSPILFNLVLEMAIRATAHIHQGALINNQHINLMAYADDVVILSETERGLSEVCTPFTEMGKRVGLECNQSKTKILLAKYDFMLVSGVFRKFSVQAKLSFSPCGSCVHVN